MVGEATRQKIEKRFKKLLGEVDRYGIQIGNVLCILNTSMRGRSIGALMFNACTVIES